MLWNKHHSEISKHESSEIIKSNTILVVAISIFALGFPAAEYLLDDWDVITVVTVRNLFAFVLLFFIWIVLEGSSVVRTSNWIKGFWIGGISILQNYGLKGDYFVLTPGAAWAQKRWPANYYSIIIDKIKENYGLNAVLIGGVNDINCELITSNANKSAIDVHGKTNLRESLAIVSQAKFIIGNDTGFLHAGESLGISAITILGPTSRETGAGVFLDRSYVIENKDLWCRPCSQNGSFPCYRKEQYCMTQIPPELIMNQISKVVS